MGDTERVAARVRAVLGGVGGVGGSGAPDGAAQPSPVGAPPPPYSAGWRQRLTARLPVRLDPGRRPAMAVGVAVLVVALVTGGWLLAQRPQAAPVSTAAPSPAATATPSGTGGPAAVPRPSAGSARAATSTASATVVVDVAGKVRRPGVYRLPAGARINDAVRAAGGALPHVDLSSLDLAARVVDGSQIRVGLRPVAGGADAQVGVTSGSPNDDGAGSAAGPAAGTTTPGTPVDLNTATLEQLDALPGVGPVLAQHILDYRSQHGSFSSVDQLNDVSGIGDVKFAALRPRVTV